MDLFVFTVGPRVEVSISAISTVPLVPQALSHPVPGEALRTLLWVSLAMRKKQEQPRGENTSFPPPQVTPVGKYDSQQTIPDA